MDRSSVNNQPKSCKNSLRFVIMRTGTFQFSLVAYSRQGWLG